MYRLVLTVAILLACFPAAWAQDAVLPELQAEDEPEFQEFFREAAQISGGRILGFTVSRSGEAGAPPRLGASIPQDWAGELACMRLTAADGLYEARGLYSVPVDWPGGVAVLSFTTKHPDVLAAYPSRHLAAAVSRGACTEPVAEVALAGINAEVANLTDPSGARLLVNSFRAEETLVFPLDTASTETIVCSPTEAPVRAEFDTACTMPDGLVAAGATRVIVAPIRRGEMGEFPVTLRVALP